ncbi:VanZ family protein [Dethiothermospora halolimnae]|uniref:VanZ family protein n=1 Tax=Dethiothermospora halolimnae TaxID=3114390 RepID=UPI003CCC212B
MNKFDEYIDKVLDKLQCDSNDKDELREEFKDHLNLLKEEYLNKGYEEDDAIKLSICDFGEENKIGKDLNQSINKTKKYIKNIFNIGFGIYLFLLTYKLLISRLFGIFYGPYDMVRSKNLIPLETIKTYIYRFNHYNYWTWFDNLFGNIIAFMPLGFLLPIVFGKCKSFKDTVMISVLFASSMEFLQYIFYLGVFDVDDIILNVIGAIIGFSIYKFLFVGLKYFKKEYIIKN